MYSANFAAMNEHDAHPIDLNTTDSPSLAGAVGWLKYQLERRPISIACGEIVERRTNKTLYTFDYLPHSGLHECLHFGEQDMFKNPQLLREHAAALSGIGTVADA